MKSFLALEEKLKYRIYRLLSFRARTEHEVLIYIEKKLSHYESVSEEEKKVIGNNLITYFKDIGLLNDSEFIPLWVAHRNNISPRSLRVLKQELSIKGVEKNLVEDYFFSSPQNEDELCRSALKRKEKILHSVSDPQKRFEKGVSYLMRKGFSYAMSKKAFEELFEKRYNDSNYNL